MKLYFNADDNSFSKDCNDTSLIFVAIDEYMGQGMTYSELNTELQKNIPFQCGIDGYEYEIQDVFEYLGFTEYEVDVTISRKDRTTVVARNPMDAEKRAKRHFEKTAEERYSNGFKVDCKCDF